MSDCLLPCSSNTKLSTAEGLGKKELSLLEPSRTAAKTAYNRRITTQRRESLLLHLERQAVSLSSYFTGPQQTGITSPNSGNRQTVPAAQEMPSLRHRPCSSVRLRRPPSSGGFSAFLPHSGLRHWQRQPQALLFLALLLALLAPPSFGAIPHSETLALLDFQNGVANPGGVNWPGMDTGSDPCDDRWPHVTCQFDALTQEKHVSALLLNDLALGGTLPTSLASLPKLKALFLGGNGFTGTVPRAYGQLSQLQQLGLNNNAFSSVPRDLFGNLTRLEKLFLTSNPLRGQQLPDLAPLSKTLKVRGVYLGIWKTGRGEIEGEK